MIMRRRVRPIGGLLFACAGLGILTAAAAAAGYLALPPSGRPGLAAALAWSAAAAGAAVLALLATSLTTLRGIAAQAGESERLRAQEAESNRLRALAREAGLRIREHLAAEDVLREAQLALEQSVDADILSVRLMHEGKLGPRVGDGRGRALLTDDAVLKVPPQVLKQLQRMFEAQTSGVMQNLRGKGAAVLKQNLTPPVYEALLQAGVVSMLITPFGVGAEVLGIIVAQRLRFNHRWTPAEIDAVESIAADLGRGLRQARLYEAENRLVAELKALDEAKSDFFATVSHELRAPLTAIEGYTELLAEGEGGPVTAQQAAMLAAVDRSTARLRSLIDDVFTLAKLESGAQITLLRPVRVADIVAAAAESVRPSAAAAKVALAAPEPPAGLTVDADAGQLERALINLLSNAVKFTPAGGCVTVTAGVSGPTAVVAVADTGIGIPEGEQKELFTRFFRASNAREAAIPGTGLGLAIVRTIMAGHGGEVDVRSREGSGTTVTLRLPCYMATIG
jgi:signal transduction histidine kinase